MRYFQTIKTQSNGKVVRVRKELNLTDYNAQRIECLCIGHHTGALCVPDHIEERIEDDTYIYLFEVWF